MELLFVVDPGCKRRKYDWKAYEECLFHFQTVTRTTVHARTNTGIPGVCRCYDCSAEVFLLQKYLREVRGIADEEELVTGVRDMHRRICRELGGNRTLEWVWERRKGGTR